MEEERRPPLACSRECSPPQRWIFLGFDGFGVSSLDLLSATLLLLLLVHVPTQTYHLLKKERKNVHTHGHGGGFCS